MIVQCVYSSVGTTSVFSDGELIETSGHHGLVVPKSGWTKISDLHFELHEIRRHAAAEGGQPARPGQRHEDQLADRQDLAAFYYGRK